MKLHELVKPKKTTKTKKFKMIISEAQFRVLSESIYQNVLNEQNTIKNTNLIIVKSDVKKK
jgi:hypothetical protein